MLVATASDIEYTMYNLHHSLSLSHQVIQHAQKRSLSSSNLPNKEKDLVKFMFQQQGNFDIELYPGWYEILSFRV